MLQNICGYFFPEQYAMTQRHENGTEYVFDLVSINQSAGCPCCGTVSSRKHDYQKRKAAASLLEGLEETLTVHRLKLPAKLRKTLSTTNPMESANSIAASCVRRITNWKDGEMILRHMAAGFLEAEKSFRRITGYREMPFLLSALSELADSDISNSKLA